MHAGDLGCHERKTAPLLRDRSFFRSPRYYDASVLAVRSPPAEFRCFQARLFLAGPFTK